MENKTHFKRALTALLAIAIATLMTASLTACGGKDDSTVIKECISQELDQIKDKNGDEWNELVGSFNSSVGNGLDQLGIDGNAIITTWLSDFDYSIKDVKIDGDTADAEVSITNKSIMDALGEWQKETINELSSKASISDDDYKAAGQKLIQKIENSAPKTQDATFTFTKSGNTWTLDEESATNELYNCLMS